MSALTNLQAENAALRHAAALQTRDDPENRTGLYVAAVVALSVLAIATVFGIYVVRPDRDNTALMVTVLGFLGPPIMGFLAAAIREVHLAFNSRMSELLVTTARAARAQGQLDAAAQSAPQRDAMQATGVDTNRRVQALEGSAQSR
jgi:hypothetical protein